MSATAERRKTNPAKRLEILQRALAVDEAALEAARAKFVELATAEDAAVRESKRAEPAKSAYTLGSPAHTIRTELAKLETLIAGLEKQVAALTDDCAAAAAEVAAQELAEATKEAARLRRREREIRARFGQLFVEAAEISNDLMATFAARGVLVSKVREAGLTAGVGNAEAVASWEDAVAPAVSPTPSSFRELIEEALAASTGPRASDEVAAARDELNRHRATLGLVPEQRAVSASRQALEESYPDLRKVVRTVESGPTGEPAQTPAEQQEGLAEAGFGIGPVEYGADGSARPAA